MRSAGIIYSSSLIGLATAMSFSQSRVEIVPRDESSVALSEVQLQKRAGTSIKDVVHYHEKANKWYKIANDHHHKYEYRKKINAYNHREFALKSNDPRHTGDVVNDYQTKLRNSEALEQARPYHNDQQKYDAPPPVSSEKLQHWKDMQALWEERLATLEKEKEKAEEAGTPFKLWNEEAQQKLRAHLQEKSGRNAKPTKKRKAHAKDASTAGDGGNRLHKRGEIAIHDVVHYAKKADKLVAVQKASVGRYDHHARVKETFHRMKEIAMRSNHPQYADSVVNDYRQKLAWPPVGTSPERIEEWKGKLSLWEQRLAKQERDMEAANRAGTFNFWDEEALQKLREHYQKRAATEQQQAPHSTHGDAQRPSIIKEDPVYYYKKADKYRAGTQKYLDHRLKAAGARFNGPLTSGDVVRRYGEKIKDAEEMLAAGQGDSVILTKKLDKWRNQAVPDWTTRKNWLQTERVRKMEDNTYSYKDQDIEAKVSKYEQSKKSQGVGNTSQDGTSSQ